LVKLDSVRYMAQACAYLCHLCLYDIGGFGEFSEKIDGDDDRGWS